MKTYFTIETEPFGTVSGVRDATLSTATPTAFVICHGLTGDKAGPAGLFSFLAEEIRDLGDVYRLDLFGHGDSTGHLRDQDLLSLTRALSEFIAFVGPSHKNIILIGHSFGCVLIANYLSGRGYRSCPSVAGAILLATDLLPGSMVEPPLGGRIHGRHRTSSALWRQRRYQDPLKQLAEFQGPLCVIVAEGDIAPDRLNSMRQLCRVEVLPTGGHLFVSTSERRALADSVIIASRRLIGTWAESEGRLW